MDVAQKIAHGAHIISQGGVIVCPTEGVYGLSALANDSKAIERIIQIKHRALNKGLIIVASNLTMLQGLVDFTKLNDEAHKLLKEKWPGHATFILPATSNAPQILTGSRDTIAVRISAFPLLQRLCDQVGGPIVSTSANVSGSEPLKTLEQLNLAFAHEVDYILDEPCQGLAKPSTIYDALTGKVLRS